MRPLKALAALAALIAIVVGPPILLVTFIGNPVPADLTLTTSLSDDAVIRLASLVVWALWLQTTWCILAETALAIRGAHLPRIPGTFAGQQHLARALVALVIAGATAPILTPHAADAVTTQTATQPVQTHANPAPPRPAPQHASEAHETRSHPEARTVTVARGDSLWKLADEHLGNGERWPEIKAANQGRTMNDGRVFRGEDALQTGWELTIPTAAPAGTDRIVQPGDTLSQIALDELGNANRYPEIFDASRHLDQPVPLTDPNLIYPGQRLDIPGKGRSLHVVRDGSSPAAETRHHSQPEPDQAVPALRSLRSIEAADAEAGPEQVATAKATATETDESTTRLPPWVLPAFVGGGSLLAGSLLIHLRVRDTMRRRFRRPGFVLTDPPRSTLGIEKSVVVVGAETDSLIEALDSSLKRLAGDLRAGGLPTPDVVAIELTRESALLHLRAVSPPPVGIGGSDDDLTWVVPLVADPLRSADDSEPPWPLLVTVGHASGAMWLLNLEGIVANVTGANDRVRDFTRFVAAEIACNPWSRHTKLDVLGTGREFAAVDPERITKWESARDLVGEAVTDSIGTIDRLQRLSSPGAVAARIRNEDPDLWPSRLVIMDETPSQAYSVLSDLIATHRDRTGCALLVTASDHAVSLDMEIDDSGTLTIEQYDLELEAVGLSKDEAHDCITLLTHFDSTDQEIAPDLEGDEPWRAFATTTGTTRAEYRLDRNATTIESAEAVLNQRDAEYLAVAAVTEDDLSVLAPKIADRAAMEMRQADPNLDDDIRDWFAGRCPRPRLTVLGPVSARTSGRALAKRKPFYTELLAYLATRPHGATPDEVACAFNISPERARVDVSKLRSWLGVDPESGGNFLPDADKAPAAMTRGVYVYQVVDALSDLDLFRRLRLRGEGRGPEGVEDLRLALSLVTGRPFQHLRGSGWGWLLEGERLDRHAECAIIDVAHVVIASDLARCDVKAAQDALRIAQMVAPDEEILRLDEAAILNARGEAQAASRIVREGICNRSDDGEAPIELPARTEALLEDKDWPA